MALTARSEGLRARIPAPTSPRPRSAKLTVSVSSRYFIDGRRDSCRFRAIAPAASECHPSKRPGNRETPAAIDRTVLEPPDFLPAGRRSLPHRGTGRTSASVRPGCRRSGRAWPARSCPEYILMYILMLTTQMDAGALFGCLAIQDLQPHHHHPRPEHPQLAGGALGEVDD